MDVEKAFDKVWHSGLLFIMYKSRIPSQFIRFINSFLTDRFTFFKIHDVTSPHIKINSGVPQGSSLSPTLFILYAKEIFQDENPNDVIRKKGVKESQTFVSQFADDIKVFGHAVKVKTLNKNLQKETNNIIDECNKLRININGTKTKQLNFKTKKGFNTTEPIRINDSPAKITDSAKFLGVTFDTDFTFRTHVADKYKMIHPRIQKLQQINHSKYGPNKGTMIRLFNIYVRPIMEYGHIATMCANDAIIAKFETTQTKFLRYALFCPKIKNEVLLRWANQLPIKERLLNLSLGWYRKVHINNNTPVLDFIANNVVELKTMNKTVTPLSIIRSRLNEVPH